MKKRSLFGVVVFLILFLLNAEIVSCQTKSEFKEITQKLEQVYMIDQSSRESLNEVQRTSGYGSSEYNRKLKEMSFQDSINRDIVFEIIDNYGWINKSTSSETASKAIFYVIQHSDLLTQIKYKELVQKAFSDSEISNTEYVLFEDRLNVRQGKYQLYGTQSAVDNIGNSFLYPVDNIDSVNIRRAKIGIQELSEQLANSQIKYNFPTEADSQNDVVFIGHIWERDNIGVDNVSVYHDNKYIGKTDLNGFFFIKHSFFQKDMIELTFKRDEKVVGQIPLNKGRDFYEIYLKLESTID